MRKKENRKCISSLTLSISKQVSLKTLLLSLCRLALIRDPSGGKLQRISHLAKCRLPLEWSSSHNSRSIHISTSLAASTSISSHYIWCCTLSLQIIWHRRTQAHVYRWCDERAATITSELKSSTRKLKLRTIQKWTSQRDTLCLSFVSISQGNPVAKQKRE